jgi:putative phosphoribosyl transferase
MTYNFDLSWTVGKYFHIGLSFTIGCRVSGDMKFEFISSRFQFKFKDRVAAAEILGESLKDKIKKNEQSATIVLGIPRGGVITADIIARKLSVPYFDIVIPRKLTDPNNKEHAIGSVMQDGITYLDQEQITHKQISPAYLETEKVKQVQEIERRNSLYGRGVTSDFKSVLNDKSVILVDDGAETGATVIAAARWIRQLRNSPSRLIIAIPVAPRLTVDLMKKECTSEVEVVIKPSSTFRSVEQYYRDFRSIPDEEVIRIMRRRNLLSV